jgi:hypothetical protein
MLYRCERADRQIIAEGRAGPRDPDVDDIEIHSSRSRGLAQLVLKRSLKVAGDVADRRFRPEILADIESQLA